MLPAPRYARDRVVRKDKTKEKKTGAEKLQSENMDCT